ncbi:uncharacterized protein LOC123543076 isoform X2 [Mercenaria mercenaria]|uniref:uncharacterized protein LOC123543076 isoform X2 n=1 Tax=Mercenaria mercenaria TaxID=6596 RepID=UPI00234F421E|nr:uncharacterized protein LOC123543076 isoform X2 [Mercenaria mercenaria]
MPEKEVKQKLADDDNASIRSIKSSSTGKGRKKSSNKQPEGSVKASSSNTQHEGTVKSSKASSSNTHEGTVKSSTSDASLLVEALENKISARFEKSESQYAELDAATQASTRGKATLYLQESMLKDHVWNLNINLEAQIFPEYQRLRSHQDDVQLHLLESLWYHNVQKVLRPTSAPAWGRICKHTEQRHNIFKTGTFQAGSPISPRF